MALLPPALAHTRSVCPTENSQPVRYHTDYRGTYARHLAPVEPNPGKRNTQKIERKHLTLRTRMKRLVRKTIGFSTSTRMYDIVTGLLVNHYAFGRMVST